MSADDVTAEGEIVQDLRGRWYRVRLDNGREINAYVCGKMWIKKVRVILGDRVLVSLSPYDLTKGIIQYRWK